MSEEEKKAIEYLKDKDIDIVYGNKEYYNSVVYKKAVKTILNLIEKQQKEIERLENIKNICPITNTSGIKCELKEKDIISIECSYDDYISKSKIKEINENTDTYYEFYNEVMKLVV